MGKYKVNEGTQVFIGDKRYVGGETFSATDAELDEFGSRGYVSEVKAAESKPAPKAEDKAQPAPKAEEPKADGKPENKAQAAPKSK